MSPNVDPHSSQLERWRGLVALVRKVVDEGSQAVERLQKHEVARVAAVVGAVPQLAAAARMGQEVHDAIVGATHAQIRTVAALVETVVTAGLDRVSASQAADAGAARDGVTT